MGRGEADNFYAERFRRSVKHPLFLVIMIGLAIRLILMPLLTYAYDISFWATTIQNIMSGNGLYDLPGYYYSPVWGYILGAVGSVGNMLLGLSSMGSFFEELLPSLHLFKNSYTSTAIVTTIEFNVLMKVPLVISDLLVTWMLYSLIKEKTGDERKAAAGAALWFLCPIVIYASSVHATFDTFSVMFMLLAVMLLRKERYLFAGVSIAAATFTKLFPAYLVIVFIAYIAARYRGNKSAIVKNLTRGAGGILIVTLLMYAPMLLDGTFIESFFFITSRIGGVSTGTGDGLDLFSLLSSTGMMIVIIAQFFILTFISYLGYRMYAGGKGMDEERLDDRLLLLALVTTALSLMWIPSPQYLLIIIPFLAYRIVVNDRKLIIPWAVMTVGAVLFAFSTSHFSVLLSLGAYTDIIDLGTVISLMESMYTSVLGISLQKLLFIITGVMEGIGLWMIFLFVYLRRRHSING
ncbi:MAG: DUF2029 domain-containing protein [Thermoplasmatales archaeon]|nr:DUF2029 domain-containing protein [Thermoplasmatales archaeon]